MELETRCETELEQAEMKFQNEQIFITQNSKLRQVRTIERMNLFRKWFVEYVAGSRSSTKSSSSTSSSRKR